MKIQKDRQLTRKLLMPFVRFFGDPKAFGTRVHFLPPCLFQAENQPNLNAQNAAIAANAIPIGNARRQIQSMNCSSSGSRQSRSSTPCIGTSLLATLSDYSARNPRRKGRACGSTRFRATVNPLNQIALATETVRINREIRARELRVIGAQGENLGILPFADALAAAQAGGLDLIEISPLATPPVAKVMDYGKFEYERSKKEKAVKAKSKVSETKEVQIKVGTGEHDMMLKAKKAAEWLAEGHRVRAELFLKGRYKGMEEAFLKDRLQKFLLRIPYAYKVAEPITRSPKGFAGVIERDQGAQAKREKSLDALGTSKQT